MKHETQQQYKKYISSQYFRDADKYGEVYEEKAHHTSKYGYTIQLRNPSIYQTKNATIRI